MLVSYKWECVDIKSTITSRPEAISMPKSWILIIWLYWMTDNNTHISLCKWILKNFYVSSHKDAYYITPFPTPYDRAIRIQPELGVRKGFNCYCIPRSPRRSNGMSSMAVVKCNWEVSSLLIAINAEVVRMQLSVITFDTASKSALTSEEAFKWTFYILKWNQWMRTQNWTQWNVVWKYELIDIYYRTASK